MKEQSKFCKVSLCEDKYGNMIVKPEDGCPAGFIEKAKKTIRERGMIFEKADDEAAKE